MTIQTPFGDRDRWEQALAMEMTPGERMSSADVVRQLVPQDESCRRSPIVPLPCVDTVIDLVADLRGLMFPSMWLKHRGASLVQMVGECLQHVEPILTEQIAAALRHAGDSKLRLHDATAANSEERAHELAQRFLSYLPQLQTLLAADVQAAFDGDPAAKTPDEIVVCYPGIHAVLVYRLAHALLTLGVPYLPRILTEWAHRETGIDIHPGAKIGPRFFIDHGTGVVIGETCVIGSSVTLYQGVTLGAWSFPRDEDGQLIRGAQRHPTLEDGVTVYSNASILGGTTVVGTGSLVGSSVTLSRSIPPNTIVTIEKPSLQFREAG